MEKIKIKDHIFSIPTTWNELNQSQFLQICKLLNAEIQIDKFNFWAFLVLIDVPKFIAKYWIFWNLKAVPWLAYSWLWKLATWLKIDITVLELNSEKLAEGMELCTQFIHYSDELLWKNYLNEITVKGGKYRGVGDHAVELTFGQFRACEPILMAFDKDNPTESYDALIEIIYKVEQPIIKSISENIKLGIWLIYAGQRQQLISRFDEAFQTSDDAEKADIDYELQWQKTLHFVAEKAQNYERYDKLNAREVLFELNETALKMRIQQEYIDTLKNDRR